MGVKLKSILKSTPWFLICKATALGVAWLTLPLWVFVALSLYFYFVPSFQSMRLWYPFLLTLIIAIMLDSTLGSAVLIAAAFYLLFGIKDLVFIDRLTAYRILVALLIVIFSLAFFVRFHPASTALFFAALVVPLSFFLLIRGFLIYRRIQGHESAHLTRREGVLTGIGAFALWQLASVLFFAPLEPAYRVLLFSVAALLSGYLLLSSLEGRLRRNDVITSFTVWFVSLVFILTLNEWSF